MAEEVARLQYRLEASTARFETQIKRAERTMQRATRRMERDAERTDTRLSRFGARFGRSLGSLLPALGAAAVTRGLDRTLSTLDGIGKAASKLGLTAEALQELRSAGEQTGVAVGTTDMALQRFVRRVEEARNGAGEAKAILEEMGIALNDASGAARPVEAVLNDVADAMAAMGSDGARLRAAFKLFDSEGAALVNTLGKGSAALDEMRQRARDMGAVIGGESVKAAEDLRTEIDLLTTAVGSKFLAAVGQAAIALNDFFNIGPERQMETLQANIDETREKIDRLKSRIASGSLGAAFGDLDIGTLESYQSKLFDLLEQKRALEQARTPAPPAPTGGGGGGGSSSAAVRAEIGEYDALILKIHEMKLSLEDELQLVGLSGAARERKALALKTEKMWLDLVGAAERDGLSAGRERMAAINETVESYRALHESLISAVAAEEAHQDALAKSEAAAARSRRSIETLGDTFTSAVMSANSFADALRNVALQLVNIGGQGLLGAGPLGDLLGGVIPGMLSSAAPSTSPTPTLRPFAQGGVVNRPTVFPMARGAGLMGEAGPEAIMPLRRGPGGRLGVEASGGGGVSVSLNVDARGANDPAAIEAAVERSSAAVLAIVPDAVRQAIRRGAL